MKENNIKNFWIGFLIAAASTAWLYWLWRRNQEVMPGPLVISSGRLDTRASDVPLPPAEEVDDLEAIRGIGSVTARRLNGAGIHNFAQLSETSPDRIREITGVTRWDERGSDGVQPPYLLATIASAK